MRVERREQVTCIGIVRVNGKPEELDGPDGRQQPSMGGTSRMSREAQVRICERLGVKFPGPTRPRGEIPRAYSPGRAGAPSEPGAVGFIEKRLESGLGLEINREKTRVVDLKEQGASLDFLGYTFRYDRDLKGRDQKYLNMFPSAKALKRERDKLHDMTASGQCFKPIPQLIGEMNRHLKGWANYFSIGYPRAALRWINTYVRDRLVQHLRRRSQRPFRPPEGVTYNEQLQRMGLIYL